MLEQLAISLGLPKDATVEQVLAALQKRDAEQRAQLDTITGAANKRGLKLDNGALVDIAPAAPVVLDFTVKPGDTPEVIALKKTLAEAQPQIDAAKKSAADAQKASRIAHATQAKKLAADAVEQGMLSPDLLPDVEELLSLTDGSVDRVMLSADGQPTVAQVKNVGDKFKKVLGGLQRLTGSLLSQHVDPATATEAAKAEKAAGEVLGRMPGRKKEEAAAK